MPTIWYTKHKQDRSNIHCTMYQEEIMEISQTCTPCTLQHIHSMTIEINKSKQELRQIADEILSITLIKNPTWKKKDSTNQHTLAKPIKNILYESNKTWVSGLHKQHQE